MQGVAEGKRPHPCLRRFGPSDALKSAGTNWRWGRMSSPLKSHATEQGQLKSHGIEIGSAVFIWVISFIILGIFNPNLLFVLILYKTGKFRRDALVQACRYSIYVA